MTTHRTISLGFLLLLTACGSTFDSDELQTWECDISVTCDGETNSGIEKVCDSEDGIAAAEKRLSSEMESRCPGGTFSTQCEALGSRCNRGEVAVSTDDGSGSPASSEWGCTYTVECEDGSDITGAPEVFCGSESGASRFATEKEEEACGDRDEWSKEHCPVCFAECVPYADVCR